MLPLIRLDWLNCLACLLVVKKLAVFFHLSFYVLYLFWKSHKIIHLCSFVIIGLDLVIEIAMLFFKVRWYVLLSLFIEIFILFCHNLLSLTIIFQALKLSHQYFLRLIQSQYPWKRSITSLSKFSLSLNLFLFLLRFLPKFCLCFHSLSIKILLFNIILI
jgi:hypothetical protein